MRRTVSCNLSTGFASRSYDGAMYLLEFFKSKCEHLKLVAAAGALAQAGEQGFKQEK